MLTISIIDASPEDAAALSALAADFFRETDTVYAEKRYTSGMDYIRSSENSDIIFLAMQMEKLNGLETARILRKMGSEAQIIFVTRMTEMAICGYEVDALDFIAKPAGRNAVHFALGKAMQRLERRSGTTLALKLPGGMTGISSSDIKYVEVFDHNLVFHTLKGEFNVRGRLSDVYEKLDSDRFFLCNRSYIVNLWYVSGIYSDHLEVDGTRITVSKSHRREITERFTSYLDSRRG